MFRELDQREGDGLVVTLDWDPDANRVWICCEDQRLPDRPPPCYTIEPRDARRAFLHPFVYAPDSFGGLPLVAPAQ